MDPGPDVTELIGKIPGGQNITQVRVVLLQNNITQVLSNYLIGMSL